jgi:hypothetical protein
VDLLGALWRKSSRSGYSGCVEFAVVEQGIALRDSKHPQRAVLVFRPDEWQAFIDGARLGEFDLPEANIAGSDHRARR